MADKQQVVEPFAAQQTEEIGGSAVQTEGATAIIFNQGIEGVITGHINDLQRTLFVLALHDLQATIQLQTLVREGWTTAQRGLDGALQPRLI